MGPLEGCEPVDRSHCRATTDPVFTRPGFSTGFRRPMPPSRLDRPVRPLTMCPTPVRRLVAVAQISRLGPRCSPSTSMECAGLDAVRFGGYTLEHCFKAL